MRIVRGLGIIAGLALPISARAAEPAPPYSDHAQLLEWRDAAGQVHPIRTPEDWAKRRAHVLAHMQEVMGPLPDAARKVPLDLRVTETQDCGSYVRRKITFAVEEDDRLPAYLLVPKRREGKLPAVLCLHPTSRDLGKGIPAGLGATFDRHYAVHLAERGYVTLAPDYVNMGEYKFNAYRH